MLIIEIFFRHVSHNFCNVVCNYMLMGLKAFMLIKLSYLILVYNTNVSKVQIGNKEPVPGSLLTIIGFILVSVFIYFINM